MIKEDVIVLLDNNLTEEAEAIKSAFEIPLENKETDYNKIKPKSEPERIRSK